MDFLNAVILGIVEGITEFLPISSTGHLIIVNRFVDFTGPFAEMFDIVIQLGALLSVIVYFWKRLVPWGREKTAGERADAWSTWLKALIGVTPALVLGALLDETIKKFLFNPAPVAAALVIGGVIIIAIESRRKPPRYPSVRDLACRTAFFIGLIQCIAMIPGTSRSAATIIGAMLLGASRSAAVEFSFFLAIPTMVAASGYSLLKTGASLTVREWQVLGTGFAVSFFVAWAVIAFLMNYIRRHDFRPFGWYRIALGLAITVFLAFGVISR
jgi:undecaprenyl-diphosphatase